MYPFSSSQNISVPAPLGCTPFQTPVSVSHSSGTRPSMAQSNSSASSTTATEPPERDVEAQKGRTQQKASHWQLVIDQTHVTDAVLNWPYKGSGEEEDPYVVEYIENDRRNPMLFPMWKKWMITLLVAFVSGIHSQVKLIVTSDILWCTR